MTESKEEKMKNESVQQRGTKVLQSLDDITKALLHLYSTKAAPAGYIDNVLQLQLHFLNPMLDAWKHIHEPTTAETFSIKLASLHRACITMTFPRSISELLKSPRSSSKIMKTHSNEIQRLIKEITDGWDILKTLKRWDRGSIHTDPKFKEANELLRGTLEEAFTAGSKGVEREHLRCTGKLPRKGKRKDDKVANKPSRKRKRQSTNKDT